MHCIVLYKLNSLIKTSHSSSPAWFNLLFMSSLFKTAWLAIRGNLSWIALQFLFGAGTYWKINSLPLLFITVLNDTFPPVLYSDDAFSFNFWNMYEGQWMGIQSQSYTPVQNIFSFWVIFASDPDQKKTPKTIKMGLIRPPVQFQNLSGSKTKPTSAHRVE